MSHSGAENLLKQNATNSTTSALLQQTGFARPAQASLGLQLGPRNPKGQGTVLAWDIFCSESPKQQVHIDPDDEDEASRSNSWVLKMCQLLSMWPILQATPSKKEEKEHVLFSSSLRISSIR